MRPGYDGPVPTGGYFVARSRTTLLIMGRAFLENKNDPKPAAESIKKSTKIYPYEPDGVGTSVAAFLSGKAKLGKIGHPPATVFHEGSGKAMNTVPPNDFRFFKMLNEIVQQEPATSLNPEQIGPVAAVGTLFLSPRDPSWFYYPGLAWMNFLFVTGYEFETPIPLVTREGVKPFPPTGYRQLDARTAFFYSVTGITPAMAMRLTGLGSQYLINTLDADPTRATSTARSRTCF